MKHGCAVDQTRPSPHAIERAVEKKLEDLWKLLLNKLKANPVCNIDKRGQMEHFPCRAIYTYHQSNMTPMTFDRSSWLIDGD